MLMRIDKFLKNSRIIKRRTVAKEACEQERVMVNGRIAKPGTEVEVGDCVHIEFGNSSVTFNILATPSTVRKEDAASLYEIVSE